MTWHNFRYNIRKQLETRLKSIAHERDKISSIPPAEYANRFMEFMKLIMNVQLCEGRA